MPVTSHGTSMNTKRLSLRTLLALVTVIALIAAVVGFSIHTYRSAFEVFEKFNSIWLTHDMLIAHLHRTDGAWPTEWKDLEPEFSWVNSSYGAPDLDWVRERIVIDFDFDPSTLDPSTAENDNQLQVMSMADGTDNGEIQSANQRLRSSLLSRRSR